MSTLSVPLTPELEDFINTMITEKKADSKAEIVRRALYQYQEELLLQEILQGENEIKNNEIFSGDLQSLVEKIS
jgi:Arc/MetJ-type ribon-helix-helix transcriptional regulator